MYDKCWSCKNYIMGGCPDNLVGAAADTIFYTCAEDNNFAQFVPFEPSLENSQKLAHANHRLTRELREHVQTLSKFKTLLEEIKK